MKRWQLRVMEATTARPAWNPHELPVCSTFECPHFHRDPEQKKPRKRDRCELLNGAVSFYCEPALQQMARELAARESP